MLQFDISPKSGLKVSFGSDFLVAAAAAAAGRVGSTYRHFFSEKKDRCPVPKFLPTQGEKGIAEAGDAAGGGGDHGSLDEGGPLYRFEI